MYRFIVALCALTLLFSAGRAQAERRHAMVLPFPVTEATDVRYLEAETFLNDDFEISLAANPSTGYTWIDYNGLPTAISFVSRTYDPPAAARPGAEGRERLRYHANATGHNHIILKYARPWEGKPAAYAVCCVYVKLPSQL